MADLLKYTLADPDIPDAAKVPANWPAAMQQEWGTDAGVTGAARHRTQLEHGFRRARAALDAFAPDFVLVWATISTRTFART